MAIKQYCASCKRFHTPASTSVGANLGAFASAAVMPGPAPTATNRARSSNLGAIANAGLSLLTRVNTALAALPPSWQAELGPILRSYATWKASWSTFPRDPAWLRNRAQAMYGLSGPSAEIPGWLDDLANKIDDEDPASERSIAKKNWPALMSPPASTDSAYGSVVTEIARRIRKQVTNYNGEMQTNIYGNAKYGPPGLPIYEAARNILNRWSSYPASYNAAKAELKIIYDALGQQLAAGALPAAAPDPFSSIPWSPLPSGPTGEYGPKGS